MEPHSNERAAGYDPRLADDPFPSTPGFWPVRQAASFVGLSVNGLVAGIENGDIPAVMRRIGPGGKRWVNVEQLRAWASEPPPSHRGDEENLF